MLVVGVLIAAACGSSGSGSTEAGASGDTTVPVDTAAGPSTSEEDGPDDTGSSTTASRAASGDADPCVALAGVDLAALVGEPVGEPNGSQDLMGDSCRVDPVSDSSAGLRLVYSDQKAADNFENQREVLGVDTEAPGLGERAFHTGPYVLVLDGDQLVMLQVIRDSATGFAVPDAELEAAMVTILDNLAA